MGCIGRMQRQRAKSVVARAFRDSGTGRDLCAGAALVGLGDWKHRIVVVSGKRREGETGTRKHAFGLGDGHRCIWHLRGCSSL